MKKAALICFLAMCGSNAFADFQSPDGNVICGDIGGMLMCYLHKQDNKKPLFPNQKTVMVIGVICFLWRLVVRQK